MGYSAAPHPIKSLHAPFPRYQCRGAEEVLHAAFDLPSQGRCGFSLAVGIAALDTFFMGLEATFVH